MGTCVRHYRKKRKLSQKAVAAAIGGSQTIYSKIENGYMPMAVVVLWKFAKLVDSPASAIIEDAEKLAETLRARGADIRDDCVLADCTLGEWLLVRDWARKELERVDT